MKITVLTEIFLISLKTMMWVWWEMTVKCLEEGSHKMSGTLYLVTAINSRNYPSVQLCKLEYSWYF